MHVHTLVAATLFPCYCPLLRALLIALALLECIDFKVFCSCSVVGMVVSFFTVKLQMTFAQTTFMFGTWPV